MSRKNSFIYVLIIFILLLSSCTTSDRLALSPLYSIKYNTVKDIKGDIDVSEMILYKDLKFSSNDIITLMVLSRHDVKTFVLNVDYVGGYWKFIKEMQLKIDDEFFTIVDDDPSRIVGSGGSVSERVGFALSDEIIKKLKGCSSLVLQYYVEPITLAPEAIGEIKKFLNT